MPSRNTSTYFGAADHHGGGGPPPAQPSTSSLVPSIPENATPATPIAELPPPQFPSHPTPAPSQNAPSGPAQRVRFVPIDRNQSAIRLRRLRQPSSSSRLTPIRSHQPQTEARDWENVANRRRSSSEPQRPSIPDIGAQTLSNMTALPPVQEVTTNNNAESGAGAGAPDVAVPVLVEDESQPGRFHRMLARGRRRRGTAGSQQAPANGQGSNDDVYDSRIVDFLDVVDPEVATLSSITNIQNSLFLPSLGKWVNRRPTYDLSHLPPMPGAFPPSKEDIAAAEEGLHQEKQYPPGQQGQQQTGTPVRSPSLTSVLSSEPQYAILPNNASLEGFSEEDVKLLNDYVRHMLHSRRSKIKQRFKAFGKYCRRPLGFLITLYATLITLFGLAWVLFLIGWIYVGEKQLYVINVIDYVLVALFAIVGDGMAPFRAVDTYHMFYVAHYHRKTWKQRKKLLLPDLKDHNDLPTGEAQPAPPSPPVTKNILRRSNSSSDNQASQDQDIEALAQRPVAKSTDEFFPVLSDREQDLLTHHQAKLAKSHTFYKPHETETHHAFPLRLLIAVVLLLDLHSCLQISLGAVTWGIPYDRRPAAATTTILCCSITANIMAGVLISIGDRRTRKKDVLERLMRQEMTEEMMKKIRKKKEKVKEEEEKANDPTRLTLGKGISVPVPWKAETDDGVGTSKSHDKLGVRKSEDGNGDTRRAKSLDVPRGGNPKPKEKEEVGRFSSDDIGGRSLEKNNNHGDDGNTRKAFRIPGAFVEEEED
ncbi:hypothetical protein QBC42DRAFT_325895 [Cladorrhinum samala]|uniref:Integral membrane protein n=1 Tax=Cladorrhinum samala TaxID=585594 RepID=A0AAV9HSY7_9PEZI|nr:hypothetical protein QBC42DRAFT_325895 [Cladorrhinum samala]